MNIFSRTLRGWSVILLTLFISLSFAASDLPKLTGGVMDEIGILSDSQKSRLDEKIMTLESDTGSQVAVLIIDSTQGESIVDYGVRVMESWQLGRKGVDDGLLLVVAIVDRTMRIEVGYGLEGVIPDAVAKSIIDDEMVPAFRAGEYDQGIMNAVDRMILLVRGEVLPSQMEKSTSTTLIVVTVVSFLIVILLSKYLFFGHKRKEIVGQVPNHLVNASPIVPAAKETSWQKHIRERREVRLTSLSGDEPLKPDAVNFDPTKIMIPLQQGKQHQIISSFTDRDEILSAYSTMPKIVDFTKRGVKHRINELKRMEEQPKDKKEKLIFGSLQAVGIAIVTGIFFASFFGDAYWGGADWFRCIGL